MGLKIIDMPTSDPGVAGALWLDGEITRISRGVIKSYVVSNCWDVSFEGTYARSTAKGYCWDNGGDCTLVLGGNSYYWIQAGTPTHFIARLANMAVWYIFSNADDLIDSEAGATIVVPIGTWDGATIVAEA